MNVLHTKPTQTTQIVNTTQPIKTVDTTTSALTAHIAQELQTTKTESIPTITVTKNQEVNLHTNQDHRKFEKEKAPHVQNFPKTTKELLSHHTHNIAIAEANLQTNIAPIPAHQSALENLTIEDTHLHQKEDRLITQ